MIIVLMGKSASGKDSLYRELLRDASLDLKKIVLYTTRPMRDGEKQGREYHFVTPEEIARLDTEGKIIEQRTYHTVHGDWTYATVDDPDYAENTSDYLMIGTLESYVQMCRYYGRERLLAIYLEVDDGERLMRALLRERALEKPRYKEMCRRFLADEEDFSAENREAAGITEVFANDDLQRCLAAVRARILQMRKH